MKLLSSLVTSLSSPWYIGFPSEHMDFTLCFKTLDGRNWCVHWNETSEVFSFGLEPLFSLTVHIGTTMEAFVDLLLCAYLSPGGIHSRVGSLWSGMPFVKYLRIYTSCIERWSKTGLREPRLSPTSDIYWLCDFFPLLPIYFNPSILICKMRICIISIYPISLVGFCHSM